MDVGKFSSKIHNAHARDHVTHRWRVKISTYLESKTPVWDVYLTILLSGFPLELGNTGWPQETRVTDLPGQETKFDDIFSRLDKLQECETDSDRQKIQRLRTASRGK